MAYDIMQCPIFDIQRYSLHDGPGIRTIVFFKGCPLSCLWCCNPESQNCISETAYNQALCNECNRCTDVCPTGAIRRYPFEGKFRIMKDLCSNCGKCVDVCTGGAMYTIGRLMSLEEIIEETSKDISYYRTSNGGVTLSGGEPLIWPDFCVELLRWLYMKNINTVVETCGYVPWKVFERVNNYVDLFLFDIKHIDPVIHEKLTGKPNDLIINNLKKLRNLEKQVTIRIPLIPELNFSNKNILGIFELMQELGINEAHIMPYHNLGKVKYERLCRDYPADDIEVLKFKTDLDKRLEGLFDISERKNINVLIDG